MDAPNKPPCSDAGECLPDTNVASSEETPPPAPRGIPAPWARHRFLRQIDSDLGAVEEALNRRRKLLAEIDGKLQKLHPPVAAFGASGVDAKPTPTLASDDSDRAGKAFAEPDFRVETTSDATPASASRGRRREDEAGAAPRASSRKGERPADGIAAWLHEHHEFRKSIQSARMGKENQEDCWQQRRFLLQQQLSFLKSQLGTVPPTLLPVAASSRPPASPIVGTAMPGHAQALRPPASLRHAQVAPLSPCVGANLRRSRSWSLPPSPVLGDAVPRQPRSHRASCSALPGRSMPAGPLSARQQVLARSASLRAFRCALPERPAVLQRSWSMPRLSSAAPPAAVVLCPLSARSGVFSARCSSFPQSHASSGPLQGGQQRVPVTTPRAPSPVPLPPTRASLRGRPPQPQPVLAVARACSFQELPTPPPATCILPMQTQLAHSDQQALAGSARSPPTPRYKALSDTEYAPAAAVRASLSAALPQAEQSAEAAYANALATVASAALDSARRPREGQLAPTADRNGSGVDGAGKRNNIGNRVDQPFRTGLGPPVGIRVPMLNVPMPPLLQNGAVVSARSPGQGGYLWPGGPGALTVQ